MKKELEMLDAQVIRVSSSPWASPIVLVEKDGDVQFCVDFHELNWVARFDAYPILRIKEVFESIGNLPL